MRMPEGMVVVIALLAVVPVGMPASGGGRLCRCPGDVHCDMEVDGADVHHVLTEWGPCDGCPGDFDGNGAIGVEDLLCVLENWGPCRFDYGAERAHVEARQVAIEMLDADDPERLPDAVFDRVARDMALIRRELPELNGVGHHGRLPTDNIAVGLPHDYVAQSVTFANRYYGAVLSFRVRFMDDDIYGVDFPGHANVRAVAAAYATLDGVNWALPDGYVNDDDVNFWTPFAIDDDRWHWTVEDGWGDCFAGCICRKYYQIETTADGTMTLRSISYWPPTCDPDH